MRSPAPTFWEFLEEPLRGRTRLVLIALVVPLLVQLSEYDLESIYAIDVLRDAEEAPLARKPEDLRVGAEAA